MRFGARPDTTARDRTRQLFRFLKAYGERQAPLKRRLEDHPWHLYLRDLPDHPTIVRSDVQLDPATGDSAQSGSDGALLTIRRPKTTEAPTPPMLLQDWLVPEWKQPKGRVEVLAERPEKGEEGTVLVPFGADPARVAALSEWKARWEAWASAERPAREALSQFERLYALYSELQQESERWELMLGDGHLRRAIDTGTINHPVLLQRVELRFDSATPALEVHDADRAPELHLALLELGGELGPEALRTLREELEEREYHPLEAEATTAFLQRLAASLGAQGQLLAAAESTGPGPHPVVVRDPVLFKQARTLGLAAACDRVLEDLDRANVVVPLALRRLAGVESDPPPVGTGEDYSPWGEPPDVLLSKPANREQVEIARALDSHGAVQVQGPPGTGKSHTIANLIGHLVAQGKRVLVTSHTTKALSVLREHIVEGLRPLAVSLLENDLAGRRQMEAAVRGILTHLTESAESIQRDVVRLTTRRAELNRAIADVTQALLDTRASEHQPIVVAGEGIAPSEAARLVAERAGVDDWLPGPIAPGAPLPLDAGELEQLYRTNRLLSPEDETELGQGVPDPDVLPSASVYQSWLDAVRWQPETLVPSDWWAKPVTREGVQGLRELAMLLAETTQRLQSLQPWERALLAAGHADGAQARLWRELARDIREAHALWNRVTPALVRDDPSVPHALPTDEVLRTCDEIITHLEGGGTLGWWTLWRRPAWRPLVREATVATGRPTLPQHFQALRAAAELVESRRRLAAQWSRIAQPAGLPGFGALGRDPEEVLDSHPGRIEALLGEWVFRWAPLELRLKGAGLALQAVRNHGLATGAPMAPYARDEHLVGVLLPPVIARRLAEGERLLAQDALTALASSLAEYAGPKVALLQAAVLQEDAEGYEAGIRGIAALRGKATVRDRRLALLNQLEKTAAAWAAVIRARQGVHGGDRLPGNPVSAWQWRQWHQELERRMARDEVEMAARLEDLRRQLRQATAELIDRKGWKAQVDRTGLAERQALQGWADLQRRIGRGTGKRAPQLQAEARRQLERARTAVPVWIMPLARVTESFSPSQGRFDVVIIDEASQADVAGLLAWYLGDQLLVVGDNEQVSPLDVGTATAGASALIAQHLAGIPNAALYDGRSSIYDFAGQCFGRTIRLREHFRCVPAIIEFSNHLCYNGEIRPLRNPASAPLPHVVEFMVPGAVSAETTTKVNEQEARWAVALLSAMIAHPRYAGATFGVISLVGEDQASLILSLALPLLGAVVLEERRFAAGNAAQFQGDERDVMLLSMVDVPMGRPHRMRQEDRFKQRFNVAASRARDQLWVLHSLDPATDLQPGDLRRELIAHVRDPEARLQRSRASEARAESPFEREVIRRLVAGGYEVEPQVWVGRYRIDIVVRSGSAQVAVECDGERYHGMDDLPADMMRQAILERAGWHFVRIRGSRFYGNPEGTMAWVRSRLADLGVTPTSPVPEAVAAIPGSDIRSEIIRAAHVVMTEQGWLPTVPPPDTNPLAEPAP